MLADVIKRDVIHVFRGMAQFFQYFKFIAGKVFEFLFYV